MKRHAVRRLLAVLLPLTWVVAASAASAGEIRSGKLASGADAIFIGGVIQPHDDEKFMTLLASLHDPVVITTGPGGSVNPALFIGTQIWNHGLSTLVPAHVDCVSACTLIWLAGHHRLMGDGARIGFHAVALIYPDGRRKEWHEDDDKLRHYLMQFGYSMDTTATIVNTPSAMVRYFDPIELDANGISTEPYP